MTIRDQVLEFHRQFGVPCPETPAPPEHDRVKLRLQLIAEEFFELLEACGCDPRTIGMAQHEVAHVMMTEFRPDIVAVADALADLDYVIEGTRLEFGIRGEPIAAEVHRSNMAKVGGGTNAAGKITKPPGWTPPDIAGALKRQGWQP